MKTRFRLLLVLLPFLAALRLAAADFDVKSYGATGDGKTLDTAAINEAIAAANAAGGGTVRFPAGEYLSFSIHLQSNVEIHLDAGSTIVGAEPSEDGKVGYDPAESNEWDAYQDFGHSHWHNSLIWGENLENIAITGTGKIFGRGLSYGKRHMRRDLLPEERKAGVPERIAANAPAKGSIKAGPFGYPAADDTLPDGVGNKAIALKNCRNVIFRDFTIYHGGHFAILATGVDNWTCDNLKIDTNRDGIDFDCCQNVRVSNCTINSPYDDGICPKSSFALGYVRPTENVTITNCQVSGYDEGTLLDGTRQRNVKNATGRIKLGTEANGGFRNITITNCVFDHCRGLALESVDGGMMESITISNLTMRDIVNSPIFIRLGARLRGPSPIAPGAARRIKIENVVASGVAPEYGVLISGLPGYPVEDLSLSNILIAYRDSTRNQTAMVVPDLTGREEFVRAGAIEARKQPVKVVPELESDYPEPSRFGILPVYGLFARHVKNFSLERVELRCARDEQRPAMMLDDVSGADFDRVKLQRPSDPAAPLLVLKQVSDFTVANSPGVTDGKREKVADEQL